MQELGWSGYVFEGGTSGLVGIEQMFPRCFNSVQRRVGCLLRSLILSGGFAESLGGGSDIQQIVGDLKKQT